MRFTDITVHTQILAGVAAWTDLQVLVLYLLFHLMCLALEMDKLQD